MNNIFSDVIQQLKAATDREIGLIDADGNVVVGGAVSSHGVQLERGIVGELRLYRSATLEGLPTSTDYISLGYTVPVDGADAGKAGAAGFFQLRIE